MNAPHPQSKPTLGVLMIVKNAEQHLEKSLASVQGWADEIVLLDSGSTDNTLEIAKSFNVSIYHQTWLGFGPQRQIAQQKMTTDWVLAIDSDEMITPQLKQSIEQAIRKNDQTTCYQVNRLSRAFGRYIRHSGWYPDKITRLYPRNFTQYNNALVHESVIIPPQAKVQLLTGDLLHETIDTLPNYMLKTQAYMKAWTDQREEKKKSSLFGAIGHGFGRFVKMYIIKRGFLDGKHGLLLAILSANTVFTRYADLWLREYTKKNTASKSTIK